jgi:hypothetical protein
MNTFHHAGERRLEEENVQSSEERTQTPQNIAKLKILKYAGAWIVEELLVEVEEKVWELGVMMTVRV